MSMAAFRLFVWVPKFVACLNADVCGSTTRVMVNSGRGLVAAHLAWLYKTDSACSNQLCREFAHTSGHTRYTYPVGDHLSDIQRSVSWKNGVQSPVSRFVRTVGFFKDRFDLTQGQCTSSDRWGGPDYDNNGNGCGVDISLAFQNEVEPAALNVLKENSNFED